MKFFLVFSLLLVSGFAHANSLVRIDCLEDTDGARVFVDGQYQFDCEAFKNFPVPLSAGSHEIRAVRSLDAEFEEVFTATVELQAGVPQRVRVALPEKTLTEYGQEQQRMREIEQQRLAEEAARKAEQERIARQEEEKRRKAIEAKKAFEARKLKAAAGDLAAMRALSQNYRAGIVVERDLELAEKWENRAEERSREIRIAELEASKNGYFEMTRMGFSEWGRSFEEGPVNGSIRIVDLGIGIPLISVPADLTTMPSVPTLNADANAEIEELERSAAATIWSKPDSLIAKALMQGE